MGTILFASDLDNTLLFSHRHRQPEDRCVERLNGAEQGFFTRETPDLLPQVVQRVHLLPITTRPSSSTSASSGGTARRPGLP